MRARRDWFPGYTVAAVSTVAFIATAPGQTFVVSQLNEPLRRAFDIDELTLNASYTIATVVASLPLVLVGSLTDRLGPRRMLALTAFAFGLGCLFMSGARGFATVALGFFLLRFLGQGALALVSQHALAMWFHRRLGSVHGLKQVVVFGLWIVFPQIAVRLIDGIGWRWTYVVFAGLIWLSVIPLALRFVKDRPEDVGRRMDDDPAEPPAEPSEGPGRSDDAKPAPAWKPEPQFTLKQALRTRAYWALASAVFLAPLIGTAFLFDIQPILARDGLDKADAANAVSAWTATMAIMALPSGWLTDRAPASALIALGTGAIALSSAALWAATTTLGAGGAMALFAVGQSVVSTCAATTIARYFGRRHHGAIRSSITRIGVIGTGLGPIFTGLSVDLTGGYGAAFAVFMAMCLPVIALNLALRAPGGDDG